MSNDVFRGLGIEVELATPDDFLVVKETLTRMGVASVKNGQPVLTQSCHILHKRGRYAVLHFKELFLMDGNTADLSEEDIKRRNVVVQLLHDWNLLTVIEEVPNNEQPITLKIIPFSEVSKWTLKAKYHIGQKHFVKK